jgi:1-acyl-sn-glycerol-3-phosphate acyltransferase
MRRSLSVLSILISFPVLAVLSFLFLPVGAFFQIFGTSARRKICRRIYSLWGRLFFLMTLSNIRITGKENIPRDKAFVLFINHSSFFDIPIISGFVATNVAYVAKRMLIFWGSIGFWILLGGGVFVERRKTKRELMQFLKVISLINSGQSFAIFPEGTRTISGEIGEFYKGSLKFVSKSGAVLIPVAISGSRELLPRGARFPKPADVSVTVGEPIASDRIEIEPKIVLNEIRDFFVRNVHMEDRN